MPLKPPTADGLPDATPTWVRQLLASVATSPVTTTIPGPQLESIGRPIADLLGATFTTPAKSGLPARVRLTNWDASKGLLKLVGDRADGLPLEATPAQLDDLITAGTVNLAQPPQKAVASVRARIAALLDAAGLR